MCDNGCGNGCDGMCCNPGMVEGSYSNMMNTIGVGDPVPFANGYYGSGDKFSSGKAKKQTPKKNNNSNTFDMSLKPMIVYTNKK